ncbi:alkylation response protein AidB-like acyl-CoA dehydrogenase [Paraburkholderia sp. BL23I1N1]|uniref:acyl-CoA dehydrogenase family protein n=1 Tax=Paraburkholderia sp. BL23I1N1 TaxID=1938802 RepID=UPI000E74207B|nr:acyl-CoA dehydrogenase family protein [Paraburkholderia sp. BL23I1N1]RKE39842.1 alkylation response protein AidB-like acyl-CoA dehydrogenase [Paraburkholderia sp. BL23I1N1]
MNLALSEEQTMIRDSAADVLAERSASAAVRQAIEHSAGRDDALWQTLAGELGWCALTVPEAAGGAGLGATELVLLMEQMGRRLACVPYFSTVCLAATALAQCESAAAREWLSRIAGGEVSATLALQTTAGFEARTGSVYAAAVFDARKVAFYAEETAHGYRLSGTLAQVVDGTSVDLLLVPALIANEAQTIALFELNCADLAGLTCTPLITLDSTRPLARVELDAVDVQRNALLACGSEAQRALSVTVWFAALALAAEQLGGAQQCLDLTLAYTAERVQFGRAIASFQAVKHRCAQMMVDIEATRSAVLGAALAWDHARNQLQTQAPDPMRNQAGASLPTEVLTDIATAKATANEAFRFCAQEAIQLHGGVGFTWEYDPQLYFKRAQASSAQFGTTAQMLSFIADQVVDRSEPLGASLSLPLAHADHVQAVLAGVL